MDFKIVYGDSEIEIEQKLKDFEKNQFYARGIEYSYLDFPVYFWIVFFLVEHNGQGYPVWPGAAGHAVVSRCCM